MFTCKAGSLKTLRTVKSILVYLNLIILMVVLTLSYRAFASTWDVVYECNEMPSNADPPWQVREGDPNLGEIVDDPEVSGNKLLFINGEGGAKIKWQRVWNADNSTGTTVVLRARLENTGGDSDWLTLRDGGGREDLRWANATTLNLTESGLAYNFDATEWHIYRATTNKNDLSLYLDEVGDPVVDGKGKLSASGDNEIYFGDESTGGTVVWYLDYLLYAVSGSYAPSEGPMLPRTVVGGEAAVSCANKLTTTWADVRSGKLN